MITKIAQDVSVQKLREIIKQNAPAVLATEPSGNVSERYEFVNTWHYIRSAMKLGWKVTEVSQQKSRKTNPTHGKHIVKLQHGDYKVGEDHIQMIITNSHDKTYRFKVEVGVFRLVCSNGLVIPIRTDISVTTKHMGFTASEMLVDILKRTEELQEVGKTLKEMQHRILTPEEVREFAELALSVRSDKIDLPENVDVILERVRPQDEGNDLYTVFNVVQEHLTQGGVMLKTTSGKTRKLRGLAAGFGNYEFNRDLGHLALEFLN